MKDEGSLHDRRSLSPRSDSKSTVFKMVKDPYFSGTFTCLEAARMLGVTPPWLELQLAKTGSWATESFAVERVEHSSN